MVFIILAKLAGEDEPRGIAQWVAWRKDLLRDALQFDRDTVPHPITDSRLLGQAVSHQELRQVVTAFLLTTADNDQGVEINLDGKTLRGTIPTGNTQGGHWLAAYVPEAGIVLCQVEVGAKENELSAAPRPLRSIEVQGKVVTGDALFAQRELSRQIVESGGDYVWTVTDNQAELRAEIEALFAIEEGQTALKATGND